MAFIRFTIVLLLLIAPTTLDADIPKEVPPLSEVQKKEAVDPNVFSIGPGKVRFSLERNGKWIEFTPVWESGRSLIAGGGIFVAAGGGGGPEEIVNTTGSGLSVNKLLVGIPKCCEGMARGLRAPSVNPDDDGDGVVDEDRLDGKDNDNDGHIDEDFAAIGDEMIVTEFSRSAAGRSSAASLNIHQECYAWSLPHLDGIVFISLTVENTGSKPLPNVRVGTFFRKVAPFTLTRYAGTRAPRESTRVAPALVCGEENGSKLAMIFFPSTRTFNHASEWQMGRLIEPAPRGSLYELIRQNEDRGKRSGSPGTSSLVDSADLAFEEAIEGSEIIVYGVSPDLGELTPGKQVGFHFALVAVPPQVAVEEAMGNALKTYLGDGENAYLPPPISMTPRVLWGTYHSVDDGVALDIEDGVNRRLDPRRIVFLSNVDPRFVEKVRTSEGVQLVLRGNVADNVLLRGERIELKGRLDSGEFFEAILQLSTEAGGAGGVFLSQDFERYWKTPGKLDAELLKGTPNPFREHTSIIYEVPSVVEQEDGSRIKTEGPLWTSVKVYNVVGRLVTVLADEPSMPGTYTTGWAAEDEHGNPVASGVYYIKLQIENRYLTKRLILLK